MFARIPGENAGDDGIQSSSPPSWAGICSSRCSFHRPMVGRIPGQKYILRMLHPENAEFRFGNRRIQSGRQGQSHDAPRFGGRDDAVVP